MVRTYGISSRTVCIFAELIEDWYAPSSNYHLLTVVFSTFLAESALFQGENIFF